MKKISLVCLLLLCPFFLQARQTWPRTFSTDSMSVTIYQPQLESFSKNLLTSYSAIKIKDANSKLSFGTVDLSARVSVNRQEDIVSLRDLKITRIRITGNSKNENLAMEEELRKILPAPTVKYTVEQLADFLTSLPDKKVKDDPLKMEPPEILFSTKESFLVVIDGEPKLKKFNSELLKLYNTPELILLHRPSNYYYLYLNSTWYRNKKLDDNWRVASVIPKVIKDAFPKLLENEKKELLIFTRTKPAELIQTYGEPDFGIIPNSNLLYVSNTKSDIFVEVSGNGIYLLLTGRWYYATQKEGPWKYLPADQLPAGFHSIPADSEKGHVRTSVKGTDEAKNEVAKSQIPETKRVKREKVNYKVEYDGDIELQRISGVSLYYVKNASKPVFKFGTDFYSCDEAVWYHSRSANGPWELATEIPNVSGNWCFLTFLFYDLFISP